MAEQNENLWAPWRLEYIRGLADKNDDGCFLCRDASQPGQDGENQVVWRGPTCLTAFNQFPYNNGHLLIAPNRHIPSLEDASDDELMRLMKLVRDCQKALSLAIGPHGFNVGMNFGRCAGAGLPDHLHIHVVPRWDGDTNFMHVTSDTDVISQGLHELYDQLVEISQNEHLPKQ